jgi:hypothetical protein
MGLVYGAARWTIRLMLGFMLLLMAAKSVSGLLRVPILMWYEFGRLHWYDTARHRAVERSLMLPAPPVSVFWSDDLQTLAALSNTAQGVSLSVFRIPDIRPICTPIIRPNFASVDWQDGNKLTFSSVVNEASIDYQWQLSTCALNIQRPDEAPPLVLMPDGDVTPARNYDDAPLIVPSPQSCPIIHTPSFTQRYRTIAGSPNHNYLLFGGHHARFLLDQQTCEMQPMPSVQGRVHWSPDGELLMAQRTLNPRQNLYTLSLWRVGGEPRVRRVFDEPAVLNLYNYGEVWSSNLRYLAYIRVTDEARSAFVFDRLAGLSAPIAGSYDDIVWVEWSPDNRYLELSRGHRDVQQHWLYDRRTGDSFALGSMDGIVMGYANRSWAPGNQGAVFWNVDFNAVAHVYWFDAATREMSEIVTKRQGGIYNIWVQWSQDGRYAAVQFGGASCFGVYDIHTGRYVPVSCDRRYTGDVLMMWLP